MTQQWGNFVIQKGESKGLMKSKGPFESLKWPHVVILQLFTDPKSDRSSNYLQWGNFVFFSLER